MFVIQKISGLEDYEINEIKDLLSCLKPERASTYQHWLYTGLILHNMNEGLLPIWKEFSQQCSDKYDEDECDKRWPGFATDPMRKALSKGTLRVWAKEDNDVKYNDLVSQHVFDMVKQLARRINHNDTAVTLHKMYGNKIICSIDRKLKKWYIFDNHIWNEKNPELHLRNYMSNQLVKECHKVTDFYSACFQHKSDVAKQEKDRDMNSVQLLTNNLKTGAFKNSVIKECETVFAGDGFHLELNNIKYHKHVEHLIALKNGVYDFRSHVFRPGKPTDMLSLSANINYKPNSRSKPMEMFLSQYYLTLI